MLGQLNIFGKTKLEVTLERIKAFEPDDGYYLAFSGGKDSQCIYHLCKMAGVKFDAHYRVTSVDPPELVQFIKTQYPDVAREIPRGKDGKAKTMWTLIASNGMPPTRMFRYCCKELKESGGKGRVTMTGVRWSESSNRKKNQGGITIQGKPKTTQTKLTKNEIEYKKTERGGVVLNLDNNDNRRAVELCYRTQKTLVNPIIDWTENEVWEFLNEVAKVPHCTLYDEGFTRLGCIGCPMGGRKHMLRGFARYPTYERAYKRAIKKMVENHKDKIMSDRDGSGGWYKDAVEKSGGKEITADDMTQIIFDWWLSI